MMSYFSYFLMKSLKSTIKLRQATIIWIWTVLHLIWLHQNTVSCDSPSPCLSSPAIKFPMPLSCHSPSIHQMPSDFSFQFLPLPPALQSLQSPHSPHPSFPAHSLTCSHFTPSVLRYVTGPFPFIPFQFIWVALFLWSLCYPHSWLCACLRLFLSHSGLSVNVQPILFGLPPSTSKPAYPDFGKCISKLHQLRSVVCTGVLPLLPHTQITLIIVMWVILWQKTSSVCYVDLRNTVA